jgi:inhibitor of cysteine peptidase
MADAPRFTQHDNGSAVEVPAGTSFSVELPENPTTGHRWGDPELDGTSVTVGSDDFEPASSEGAGAGGVRRFTFHVKSPGKTTLRLAYGRSWETGKDAARRFELTVAGTS